MLLKKFNWNQQQQIEHLQLFQQKSWKNQMLQMLLATPVLSIYYPLFTLIFVKIIIFWKGLIFLATNPANSKDAQKFTFVF